ncbi:MULTISPECIES: ABC transporter permease [unclassified Uliginosibacterium]|uniref:ABC transporter permease n=1 Tax=unclassified Uliginosibacterium TaxID=2621521 RepID=UPI001C1F98F0|nr:MULTISPECIES: ABC transporter permease [unclassified Uliginosibacterium]MDO6386005.1 ABC transporter permease [Uliginosibacterium sp. 31-12]
MSAENKQATTVAAAAAAEPAAATVNMANLRGGIEYASQWELMWARFKKHKVAYWSMMFVAFLYVVAVFAEFLSPFDPEDPSSRTVYQPPQMVKFDGFKPYVTKFKLTRDPETLKPTYVDTDERTYLRFFVPGFEYKMLGLVPTNLHLFGPAEAGEKVFLFGSDRLGRDMFSRVIYGARFTLSMGLIGVILSTVLGIVLGGISGYYGGKIDWFIQRVVEFILSLPTIPIWLAMAAAMPKNWPPHLVYISVTVIISLIGWTHLARVVRGKFLAMRGEVFVIAAKLDGCSEGRVIFRHMLPSMASHVIAAVTLAIPSMILAETTLSFLGLGLQPPAISWGVLLKDAQKISVISAAPWLFLPGVATVLAVLAMNFFGDGLRDAADPYSH